MNMQYQIKNVTQWLALPEIEIPKLNNPNEKGKVHDVKNVGFFMADIKQCSALNIIGKSESEGKVPLPSIVILFEGRNQQFRLPVELNDWVHSCVSLSASGINPFPCKVEIGNLSGNIYAEIL